MTRRDPRGLDPTLARLGAAVSASLLGALALAAPALALQTMPADVLPQQSLRAYWHVFVAYAIVILLVFGYVVSIARRLSEVEKKLGG